MAAQSGQRDRASPARDRTRHVPVLVTGQSIAGLLCGRETQTDRYRGWADANTCQCAHRQRRLLERNGRDRLRAECHRRSISRAGRRGRGGCAHPRSDAGTNRAPSAGVPPRCESLPVLRARHPRAAVSLSAHSTDPSPVACSTQNPGECSLSPTISSLLDRGRCLPRGSTPPISGSQASRSRSPTESPLTVV